ncbi:hypothetical protein NDU88_004409 [Pleurodeles waltl]|uniref:Uncharacterized protein n=1 Tax=Pleurodeles waltl TaxID=8319 RepID=A0AAV7WXN7_PLEWA|nr:hypothetical protein NDU88_004409 [Pleurodeles waltl]
MGLRPSLAGVGRGGAALLALTDRAEIQPDPNTVLTGMDDCDRQASEVAPATLCDSAVAGRGSGGTAAGREELTAVRHRLEESTGRGILGTGEGLVWCAPTEPGWCDLSLGERSASRRRAKCRGRPIVGLGGNTDSRRRG